MPFDEIVDISIFLAALAPYMHETKCRGARDLLVVKVSALYDPWPSKKRQTKVVNIDKIMEFVHSVAGVRQM